MTEEQQSLIDWQTVWDQLNWDSSEHQEEIVRERLRQRAVQYATVSEHVTIDPDDTFTLLTFQLANETFGIDVVTVRGVRTIAQLASVPGAPPFYRGLVNIRGQVITVFDLRRFFDMTVDEDNDCCELVIIAGNRLQLGLMVHHVSDVVIVDKKTIKPVEMAYARGMTADQLIVLDIEKLLTDERLIVGGGAED